MAKGRYSKSGKKGRYKKKKPWMKGLKKAWAANRRKHKKHHGKHKRGAKSKGYHPKSKRAKRIAHLPRCIKCRRPVPAHMMAAHYKKRHEGRGKFGANPLAKVDWAGIAKAEEQRRVNEQMRAAQKAARDYANPNVAAARAPADSSYWAERFG